MNLFDERGKSAPKPRDPLAAYQSEVPKRQPMQLDKPKVLDPIYTTATADYLENMTDHIRSEQIKARQAATVNPHRTSRGL